MSSVTWLCEFHRPPLEPRGVGLGLWCRGRTRDLPLVRRAHLNCAHRELYRHGGWILFRSRATWRGSGFRRAMGGAGAREGGRGRLRPQRCCRVGAAGRGAGWGRCSSARGRSKRAQTACPAKSASEDHGQEWSGWALARAPGGRAANGWYESDTVVCREEVHMLIYSPDPPNTPFPISGAADLETARLHTSCSMLRSCS